MTLDKAIEHANEMPDLPDVRKIILQTIKDNPNTYYVDYQSTNSFGVANFLELRVHVEREDWPMPIDHDGIDRGLPPQGRSQKAHNNIHAMNKRKR